MTKPTLEDLRPLPYVTYGNNNPRYYGNPPTVYRGTLNGHISKSSQHRLQSCLSAGATLRNATPTAGGSNTRLVDKYTVTVFTDDWGRRHRLDGPAVILEPTVNTQGGLYYAQGVLMRLDEWKTHPMVVEYTETQSQDSLVYDF